MSAQSEDIELSSYKDSLSFALGIETALDVYRVCPKCDSLNKKYLVVGFKNNLSSVIPDSTCEIAIKEFMGFYGEGAEATYSLKEVSKCFGQYIAYSFYYDFKIKDLLSDVHLPYVLKGFKQGVFKEHEKSLSNSEKIELLEEFEDKVARELVAKVERKDSVFWEQILGEPGVKQLGETGIYLKTLKEGDGGSPNQFSDVEAHYILTNNVGDTLENSFIRGETFKLNLQSVIEGWREGFPYMKKGGKYQLYVPYEKAYKNGNVQAPQGALNFYIEFIDYGPEGTITGRR